MRWNTFNVVHVHVSWIQFLKCENIQSYISWTNYYEFIKYSFVYLFKK